MRWVYKKKKKKRKKRERKKKTEKEKIRKARLAHRRGLRVEYNSISIDIPASYSWLFLPRATFMDISSR